MNWTNTRNEGGVWKLHDEVSSAAFESMEALWSAFLEVGDLDMVRSTEKALRLMASHGDHTGAMKLLEGICALTELTPTKDFTDCQRHPALAQMFMEKFLAESEDFIFDTGMDNVMDLIMNEAR